MNKRLFLVGVIALMALASVYVLYPSQSLEDGSLKIRAGGTAQISLERIKELPSSRRQLEINSAAGTERADFRGVELSAILNDVGVSGDFKSVAAKGADGYASILDYAEVFKENNVFVMYENHAEPILTMDGKPRGMRLIILRDQYGQRFTNFLYEIELR